MGTTGAIILAVLIVAWQVISAMIQQSAKRQEEQRRREMAARRQQQGAGQAAAPTTQSSGFRPPSQSAQPQTRGPLGATARDDLGARRQAQLEELRRRRQTQGGTTLRAGTPPAPPRAPIRDIPAVSPSQPTIQQSSADLWRQEQARQGLDRQRQQQERAQQAAARWRQGEQEAVEEAAVVERERLRKQLEQRRQEAAAQRAAGGALIPVEGMTTAQRLRKMINRRHSLRDIFIMKELLEKPITERRLGAGDVPAD